MQARVLPELLAQGADIVVEGDARLFPLLNRTFPSVTTTPLLLELENWLKADPADYRASMLSAWRWTSSGQGADAESLAAYLTLDPESVAAFRERWNAPGRLLQVGLSWHSGAKAVGRAKSVVPEMLAPLIQREGIQFHSLQYDMDEAAVAELSDRLGSLLVFDRGGDTRDDIDRLAARIAALDLVISIDNTTIHIVGAVGTPCWVLLPCQSDWRWGREGHTTHLYRDMWLDRNRTPGHWGAVVAEVVADFDAWHRDQKASHGRCQRPCRVGISKAIDVAHKFGRL
tara:strand:+ start:11473 stop:12330 length:858 start_codon:yes stop_codon:yes gene_type:complete